MFIYVLGFDMIEFWNLELELGVLAHTRWVGMDFIWGGRFFIER
jgi:hypothetical protein